MALTDEHLDELARVLIPRLNRLAGDNPAPAEILAARCQAPECRHEGTWEAVASLDVGDTEHTEVFTLCYCHATELQQLHHSGTLKMAGRDVKALTTRPGGST